MTQEEADAIGRVIGTADGGCSTCIAQLAKRMSAAFPAFEWEPTDEDIYEQPDWSDDPEDIQNVGYLVVARSRSNGMED